jgi:hypothetical protein
MYTHVSVYTYMYVYVYVHAHARKHTHTHTQGGRSLECTSAWLWAVTAAWRVCAGALPCFCVSYWDLGAGLGFGERREGAREGVGVGV